jgi:hypothetical protein
LGGNLTFPGSRDEKEEVRSAVDARVSDRKAPIFFRGDVIRDHQPFCGIEGMGFWKERGDVPILADSKKDQIE